MTITDTAAEPEAEQVAAAPTRPPAVVALVLDADHKSIGRMFIGASLLFLLLATVLGAVVDAERLDLGSFDVFDDADSLFQAFTLQRVSLVFLGVVPLLLGLGLLVVPLQIGSPSAAFPRAAAASFWGWLFGAGILITSFAIDGGLGAPGGAVDRDATLLSVVSLGLVVASLVLGSVCLATTVIALRPAGMTLADVPFFAWSSLVGASLWVLTLPALFAGIVLAAVDLNGRPPIFFGVPETMAVDFLWSFRQPQVYAFAVPVLGIIADVVPVAAKVRQRHRGVILAAIALFGLLGFGAYARELGDGVTAPINAVIVAMGFLAVLPVLMVLGGLADTLVRGSSNLGLPSAPLLGSLLTGLLLLGATTVGLLRVIDPLELIGTSADSGHMVAVLLAALVGAAAGLQHWGVKITGARWSEGIGRLALLVLALGVVVAAVPHVISGFLDQPDFPSAAEVEDGVEALNAVAFAGSIVVVLALVLVVLVAGASLLSRSEAPADPWGGQTLEWATPSPPPVGNFTEPLPPVTSAAPLLDAALSDGAE